MEEEGEEQVVKGKREVVVRQVVEGVTHTVVVPPPFTFHLISAGNLLERRSLMRAHMHAHVLTLAPPHTALSHSTLSENGNNGVNALRIGRA